MADIKSHSTLPTNLISYWDMEEASGTRYDLVGSNNLTDLNTVGQATGKNYGNGADFETSNNEQLDVSSPTMPTGDMSVSLWVKLESIPSGKQYAFWDKYKATANQRVGIFQVLGTAATIECRIWDSSDNLSSAYTTNALSASTWYHLVVTFDASTGTISVYIDGTEASYSSQATAATGISTNTNDLAISGRSGSPSTNPFDGVIDEYGMWSKVLTADEISDLYNSGSGLQYYDPADVKNDTTLSTSLVSYYELEDDVTDSHGSNDLTAVGSPTYVTGKQGQAITLNGSTQYANINDGDQTGLDITGDMSGSAWINLDSTSQKTILGKRQATTQKSYFFAVDTSTLYLYISDDGTTDSIASVSWTPSTGTWYHVAFAYDTAGEVTFYVDGVQQGATQTGKDTSIYNGTSDFALGAFNIDTTPTWYTDGEVDEVALWSKTIGVDEVRALYGYGTPPIYAAATSTRRIFTVS